MVDKTPAQITPGTPSRGSVVHASDAGVSDLSRSHVEEDISRLQSATIQYSASLTYEIGDFVVESGDVYRCTTTIVAPETFNPGKWTIVGLQQTPWLQDVDADGFDLNNLESVVFNQISEPATPPVGDTVMWVEQFLNLDVFRYKASDDVVENVLEDNLLIGRNNTGVTIAKGQAVYISGADGTIVEIELAQADTLLTSPAAGVAQSDILNGDAGFVVINGTVTGLNTLGFTVGDILFLSASTPGDLVSTPPLHPNLAQIMGAVLSVNATTGSIGIFIGQIGGAEGGTRQNSFRIGDTLGGAKTILFENNFTGTLSWNPTANQTLTLPDASDTLIGRVTTDTLIGKTMSGFSNTFTDTAGFTGLATQTQDLNMGNNKVVALDTPTDGTDAANKTYVDNLASGLKIKEAAIVATTGDITLSGEQTIDGVLTSTDRVLVKDQTAAEENGVYDSAAGAWSRTTDTDTDTEIVSMSIFVEQGTANADTSWALTTPLPIVIDTTPLIYAQTSAGTNSPLTTKGDIWGYDTGQARIPVGTDSFVLTANSSEALGVSWTEQFLTPWVSNIDANGFDLVDLSNIEFRNTTGAPTGVSAIWLDGGGLNIENVSGGIMKFVFNGSITQSFTSDQLEMNGTFIDNVSHINSNIGSPATDGFIRMGFNEFVNSRNISNTGDVRMIGLAATGDTAIEAEVLRNVQFLTGNIITAQITPVSLDMLDHEIDNIEFADFGEIASLAAPDANHGRLFVQDDNSLTKMFLVDSSVVITDISSAGFLTTTASTDSVSDNQYFGVSGRVLTGNNQFVNEASLIPRKARFSNLYLSVTSNSSNTETWTLYDGSGSATDLQVTIPSQTTGIFSNTTTVVTLDAGTLIAYRITNINGTFQYAATGMAMDVLV